MNARSRARDIRIAQRIARRQLRADLRDVAELLARKSNAEYVLRDQFGDIVTTDELFLTDRIIFPSECVDSTPEWWNDRCDDDCPEVH